MESQSLKLRNILEFHNLPISPTHRFSLLVHPCELTSLPSLFSSSSNPSHTRILHQFSRIQTAPCCKEPVHFPIDSVETSSSHAFQSASKVEDDDTNSMPSDIGLIQRAAWIGLTTIMSKILRLIREIIVASVFGIEAKIFGSQISLFPVLFLLRMKPDFILVFGPSDAIQFVRKLLKYPVYFAFEDDDINVVLADVKKNDVTGQPATATTGGGGNQNLCGIKQGARCGNYGANCMKWIISMQLGNIGAEEKRTDTDENMFTMFDILKSKRRVKLESLILNRKSFAQTVENLFALSFLVKDGRVIMAVDEKGSHLVSPTNAADAPSVMSGEVAYSHFVFRYDFKDWKACLLPTPKGASCANYARLSRAVSKALMDRVPYEEASMIITVLMVVGAGRGPLVRASLQVYSYVYVAWR
ncbi:hypothetical protein TEA_010429 [Camellia sinensis var. sinensis]|uniref:Non-structural maintenance of chromosomes element 4 n=1 Tax=Camellia sinensis var. sinensis TaxID=542762 RepID=A0A4S4F1T3_CAMSN|nr:hypothetical protein TEA_010429 [Camellia sinensis var. sinensis]